MNATPVTRSQPHNAAVPLIVGAGIGIAAVVWAALKLGTAWAGMSTPVTTNPLTLLFDLANGSVAWPRQATYALVLIVVGLALLAVAGAFAVRRIRGGRRTRVDPAARHLGRGRDVEPTSKAAVTATAQRLGVHADTPGVFLGKTVASGADVYGSYEDMLIEIAGPRTGKTTARAVPAIADAPGPVIVTSNKRDILDATRGLRDVDDDVWVFDPQRAASSSGVSFRGRRAVLPDLRAGATRSFLKISSTWPRNISSCSHMSGLSTPEASSAIKQAVRHLPRLSR